jgi:hypothetical protein
VGSRGLVTAMCVQNDGLTMTVGTSAGLLSSFDLRYSVSLALYEDNMHHRIDALSLFKQSNIIGFSNMCCVSVGGNICLLNLDTAKAESVF